MREYRIAAEYRRCCWYGIAAALPLCGVAVWVWMSVEKRHPVGSVIGLSIFPLTALALTWPLIWRLRVDDQGLSRRRLWWWDHWSWFEVKNGQIRKRPGPTTQLIDAARPIWRRTLPLGYLEEADQTEVLAAINAHYQMPRAPALPASLELRYQVGCALTFNAKGLHLRVRRRPHDYAWSDVRDVHLTRLDPMRRDFTKVVITLPDREIELLGFVGETPTTRELASEFLARHVPPDKITVTLWDELPSKRAHVERALNKLQKTERELKRCLAVGVLLLVAWLIWFATQAGIVGTLAMAAMFVLYPGSVIVVIDRLQRKRIAEMKRRLREVAERSFSAKN